MDSLLRYQRESPCLTAGRAIFPVGVAQGQYRPLSVPKTLSTAESLKCSPDRRDRDGAARGPATGVRFDPKIRRMEYFVGTASKKHFQRGFPYTPFSGILGPLTLVLKSAYRQEGSFAILYRGPLNDRGRPERSFGS